MEIRISNLTKRYKGDKYGLREFSLELNNGVLGLIGPNGAGKSTLMRILATISRPTAGQVTINGADIVKQPDAVRQVLGYLPQDFGVYPNLTAVEFLTYMAAIKGFSGKAVGQRIEALLGELNLFAVRNQPLGSYSGGMRQRIGIAQVLIGDPRLIILDEPTVGLDPEERVRFRNLLTDLSGDRIVILSSHIVSDIETIAGDIAVVSGGRLLEHALPDVIMQKVENSVFETVLSEAEFGSFRSQHLVSNSVRRSGGWTVRFVLREGEAIPSFPVQQVKPTLEDAYLRVIDGARNGGAHAN
jgi:ABC-type multidrug transport system ATPase subunit